MPFTGKKQLAIACQELVARAGLAQLWTVDGPTREASTLLNADEEAPSTRARVLLLAVWVFWDGSEADRFALAIKRLGGGPLEELRRLATRPASQHDDIDS